VSLYARGKNSNIMTRSNIIENGKKIYVLEWTDAEIKNGTMRCEKFKVIAGSEKEELNFYSTFFVSNNKFKKGEIYELSTPGNFVEDSSGIIQGINNGGYEFEKIHPSLMIQELWEKRIESIEKLNRLEEDLRNKKEEFSKKNQEFSDAKRELTNLQNRFNNLQLEKRTSDEKIISLERDIQEKGATIQQLKRELNSSENKITKLEEQLNSLQKERDDMKVQWASPEEKSQLTQTKENLNNQLKVERRKKQELINMFENLRSQDLNKTFQDKLTEKKEELTKLKFNTSAKLGDNQEYLLENLLEKQEDFDLALFDDVNQMSRTFLRAKDKLQDAKDKLTGKISSEEVEGLCKLQTEIGKLESSQKQWEKMESQQVKEEQEQFESFIGTPPPTPRNN